MAATYTHNGKELLHGEYTESGKYRVTQVDGQWYYHPADSDWLAFNANEDFSETYPTAEEALAAAEEFDRDERV